MMLAAESHLKFGEHIWAGTPENQILITTKKGEHAAACSPFLAGVEGFEPPALGFGDRCSGQLSYTPRS